ncbi:MAG: TAXI family TRAP transporter solute-binding subunit [Thiothrix sp.]|nr:TAXI family TRAP transporter solute-binding subunit [Thiothrix sp.]HPQ93972.1 TAXI family TRAP transporter solute-binding subunit [Thiolinea sp.]
MHVKFVKSLLLTTALSLCALPAWAEKVSMETGGTNSVVGLLPQTMAPYWSKAGIDVELAMDQTLTKSLLKIGQGNLDAAVMPPPAYLDLREGKGAYAKLGAEKGKVLTDNVRSLFGFSASILHPIVWADGNIKTWADLKDKQVYIGPPAGSANLQIISLIKEASGYEAGKDYKGIKAPWGVALQGFRDGQYDMVVTPQPLGSQALTELSLSREIRIMSLAGAVEPPKDIGVVKALIPKETYSGQINRDEDVHTWETVMMLAVRKDLSEETAYNMTKTYFDNLDEAQKGNALLKGVHADQRFGAVVTPLHPGAVRYYQEQNIEIPADLLAE